jgi:hypothetical protein
VAVDVTDLELESRLLGGLPIVNVFYDRLGIDRLLEPTCRAMRACGCRLRRRWGW